MNGLTGADRCNEALPTESIGVEPKDECTKEIAPRHLRHGQK
jgi:hypothetical protein